MVQDKPIIEYFQEQAINVTSLDGKIVQLYEDGKVKVIRPNGLKINEYNASPDKILSLVDKLVQIDFFNYKDKNEIPNLRLGDDDCFWLTFNHQGKSKKVKFLNTPLGEFEDFYYEFIDFLYELLKI